ncbi:collagen-like protein [Mucilaginibacter lappiensis]|uniref:Collagen triple helix repeat-containing protein n=1 Tax=Mucilaginibacter lappiensis TaxID=354630 RepID=A0A841JFB2_9SPHI|nr:collagen-like protein [Mucilaginibacter lappiensis]MBB6127328.1 hypothetical protein [Mucilaginibacter lappiensis]
MKNFNSALLLLAAVTMLFTASCSKDGTAGPKGDTGDKGSIGAVGPAGPAGTNGAAGSMIYSGTTVPPATKGVAGDYYLNTTTGLLYGPKTAAGWGSGLSLKGATGATGAAGSATLSGAGTPAPSLGNNGDYYLDKTNYLLYGPKTSGGWGTPVNLRGPSGNSDLNSVVFTVNTADWNQNIYNVNFNIAGDSVITRYAKGVEYNSPLLTAGMLERGLVLVYFQPNPNVTQWQPLPYSFPSVYDEYNYNYAYETFVSKVRLYFYFTRITTDGPSLDSYQVPATKFRIVVASGNMANSIHQNHININKYEEVSRFLNIK